MASNREYGHRTGLCLHPSRGDSELIQRTLSNFWTFTPKHSEICRRVSRLGWHTFVHHFETVEGATPNCSANHLFVLFFSAKTTFSRLMSLSISDESIIWDKDTNNFVIMRKFLLFLTIIFNYISLFSFSRILFPVFYRQLCDFMHSLH
jgi:hypothetical protein